MQNTDAAETKANGTNETPQKTSRKTFLIGAAILIGIIAITFFTISRQAEITDIISAIQSVNPLFVLLGLGCMFVYMLGEGINLRRVLRMQGHRATVGQGLKYSILGSFFSAITPCSSGGQPMQMYYMYEDDVKAPQSFLAVMVHLMGWQAANLIFALTGFIYMRSTLAENLGPVRFILLLGIFLHLLLFLFVVVLLYTKRALDITERAIHAIIGVFKFKGMQGVQKTVNGFFDSYRDVAGMLKGRPSVFFKTVGTTLIMFLAMLSIPFLVYKGMNLSGAGFLQLFFAQAVTYAGVGFIPIPGAVGTTETVFMLLFKFAFPTDMLAGAMLLCRSISLYLCLIFYAIAVCIFTRSLIRKKTRSKAYEKQQAAAGN